MQDDDYTKASPVKITRADGTIEWQAAYTPDELAEIVSPTWKMQDRHKWAQLMRLRRWEAQKAREEGLDE